MPLLPIDALGGGPTREPEDEMSARRSAPQWRLLVLDFAVCPRHAHRCTERTYADRWAVARGGRQQLGAHCVPIGRG